MQKHILKTQIILTKTHVGEDSITIDTGDQAKSPRAYEIDATLIKHQLTEKRRGLATPSAFFIYFPPQNYNRIPILINGTIASMVYIRTTLLRVCRQVTMRVLLRVCRQVGMREEVTMGLVGALMRGV